MSTSKHPADRDARRRLLLAAALALAGPRGLAQDGWPNKPVTLVVPFPPGGGTDAFAGPLGAQLGKALGQPFIIEHRGGAGGTVGAGVAARAAPDGYTLLMGAVHHAIAPAVHPKLDYDIETDFVPIGLISRVPQVIVVHAQRLPVADLKELLELLRDNPGKYAYASAGHGTSHHLAAELFKLQTNTSITHVAYDGAGPAMKDLITGRVDIMFDGLGSSAAHIRAGRIKALALASDKRLSAFPDLPTVVEFNLRDYKVATWYGLWAPKGTPPDVVLRLQDALRKALNSDELAAAWRSLGSTTPKLYGQAFGRFVAAETKRWADLARATGAKPQ